MKSQMIIKYKIHFNQHDIGVEYLTILLMTNLGKWPLTLTNKDKMKN